MDKTFIQERITKTKEMIVAYEDAAIALGNGTKEYMLDTGQTRTKVTKFDIDKINQTIDSLYNRCATLEARLNGSGVVVARPGF